MVTILILIAQTAMSILAQHQIGGTPVNVAEKLMTIISAAKQAYEEETGEALDISKVPPYTDIV